MADSISRRHFLGAGAVLLGGVAAAPVLLGGSASGMPAGVPLAADPVLPWPQANTILAETKLPVFPAATFPVTAYGGKGDGKTDNTAAFRAAVDAANTAGGGHVTVPSGTWVTGAIYLKSNVDLNLASGATLKFSGDSSKYPTVLTRYEGIECMNRSPMIYAHGEHNIAVTGAGTLDAGGTSSWNTGSDRAYLESLVAKGVPASQRVVPGSGHKMRSTFIEPYGCDTVLIQGVTLKNSQFWQLHPTLSSNVTVDGVTTSATHSNSDGCDPESCDHVVIKNSTLGAYDDNIAIKSGRDDDGRRINVPSQNIVVFGCHFAGPWGAITCGSEQTGGIRNVYAYNCVADPTRYVLFIKSNTKRGGFTRNVNLDSFTGRNLKKAFAFATSTYNSQTGSHPPEFSDITVTRCQGSKFPIAFDLSGLSGHPLTNLTVSDSAFTSVSNATDHYSNVSGIHFSNVTINGKQVTR